MSVEDGLDPQFRIKLHNLLTDCGTVGVIMRPYFGVRHPVVQGKLWRQSRDKARIDAEIATLRANKCNYLADCIVKAGPSSGPWATNAIPGLSWHQYGDATDCEWLRNGVVEWSTDVDGDKNGYKIYAAKAAAHGLTNLIGIGDAGHVQGDPHGSPQAIYTLQQIDAKMLAKFGPL